MPGRTCFEMRKLERAEKHIGKCEDSRRLGDWRSMLREVDAAIASEVDASPELFACRAEAFLKLSQLEDADLSLAKMLTATYTKESKIFGMLSEVYILLVGAQVELALGRFENALLTIQKAAHIDSQNIEVSRLLSKLRFDTQARIHGNDLFKSGPKPVQKRSDSGETSGSSVGSSSTARGFKPGHAKSSDSGGSHSGGSTASSSALNTLPPCGNIFPSGKVTIGAYKTPRPTVMRSGTWNYGYGSIMWDCGPHKLRDDPEELKRMGNEQYKNGEYAEALNFYDKAIAISPTNAVYHCDRAAALIALKLLDEALRECEEAIRLDPAYVRAHHQLGSLFLSLGQVENARRHMCLAGHQPDDIEMRKLERVEKHIGKCNDARRLGVWRSMLMEADATIASGADASPELFACRAEAFLKLSQLEDADSSLAKMLTQTTATHTQSKIFGMLSEAYLLCVGAQVELALGRFENAISTIEKAAQIDSQNIEVSLLLSTVRLVSQARINGNDLFKSGRYTEACAAYGDGLRLHPSNSVLYCNRATCWYKLGQWEKTVSDCNQALHINPKYTKALLQRAASNMKLELWAEAVRDYEVLRREVPRDDEVAESLFYAECALKKSTGEGEEICSNVKLGGEVENVSGVEQFEAAILSPGGGGVSVVYFKTASNVQCWEISAFLDTLRTKYPSIKFLKVDIEDCPEIGNTENVKNVPTFKIYKNGERVKDLVCPSPAELAQELCVVT